MAAIARVEVGRFDYDLIGDFKFFKTGVRPTVVVRLTDDNGVQGFGQSVPVETWTYETVESVETTLRHYIAPAIVGADPADLAAVHARMERAIRPSFSVGQPLCKAAIDLACYDLWGRQTRPQRERSLGGAKRDSVKLSWTVKRRRSRAPNSSSRSAARKATTASTSSSAIRRRRNTTSRSCRPSAASRRTDSTGPMRIPVTISTTALAMAPRLADAGIRALESPLPPNRIRDYQALRRQGALPILMDEGIVSPVEVEEFIALNMFDGIAMKVARCGGLTNASRIVTLLAENDLRLFASGLTDTDLSLAASCHLFASAGLSVPAALNGPQYVAGRGSSDPAFRADGDLLRVPTGPGSASPSIRGLTSSLRLAARVIVPCGDAI